MSINTLSSSPSPLPNNGKMPRCIVEKEFDRKRAYDIMRRMESEGYSLTICEWGARGFASIAGTAMMTQNAESLADFLDDGGCESLVHIMNHFAETSVVVAAYGCLTASILAWSLRELKEFLGEIGAGEIVVFATSMHIGDPLVSEFGTRAIGLLAKQNISNSYRLAQAGACDALAQAGNFGFNLRHEHAVDVAGNVCLAFSELAEAVNAHRLMDCGASALVVALTKFHHKQEDFAGLAMHAICALASLNAQHREELGRCDVCPLVVKMLYLHATSSSSSSSSAVLSTSNMHTHNHYTHTISNNASTHNNNNNNNLFPSSSSSSSGSNSNNIHGLQQQQQIALVLEGCEAIMHLSLSPNNANRLGHCGGCAVVCQMLQTKLHDVEFGAEVCTGAMLNLSLYGEDARANRRKLVQSQAIELLRKTQFSPRASYKARENIVTLLDLLATEMAHVQEEEEAEASAAAVGSEGNATLTNNHPNNHHNHNHSSSSNRHAHLMNNPMNNNHGSPAGMLDARKRLSSGDNHHSDNTHHIGNHHLRHPHQPTTVSTSTTKMSVQHLQQQHHNHLYHSTTHHAATTTTTTTEKQNRRSDSPTAANLSLAHANPYHYTVASSSSASSSSSSSSSSAILSSSSRHPSGHASSLSAAAAANVAGGTINTTHHHHHHARHGGQVEGDLISIIHGSEMKGDTVPLKVEVREVVEYSSFAPFDGGKRSPTPPDGDDEGTGHGSSGNSAHDSNENDHNGSGQPTKSNLLPQSLLNTIFTQNNQPHRSSATVKAHSVVEL